MVWNSFISIISATRSSFLCTNSGDSISLTFVVDWNRQGRSVNHGLLLTIRADSGLLPGTAVPRAVPPFPYPFRVDTPPIFHSFKKTNYQLCQSLNFKKEIFIYTSLLCRKVPIKKPTPNCHHISYLVHPLVTACAPSGVVTPHFGNTKGNTNSSKKTFQIIIIPPSSDLPHNVETCIPWYWLNWDCIDFIIYCIAFSCLNILLFYYSALALNLNRNSGFMYGIEFF